MIRQQTSHVSVIRWMLFVAGFMFIFAFLLVPLYDALCKVTGLNGKTAQANEKEILAQLRPEPARTITVEFVVTRNEDFPWSFQAQHTKMQVHPGEVYENSFRATNSTSETMYGQAVPSLAPGLAAKYFKKTECFCFTQQELAGGEVKDMPVRFIVDPEIPKYVSTLTLSYTFFKIGKPEINQGDGFVNLSNNAR